jgi:uncharacterized protein
MTILRRLAGVFALCLVFVCLPAAAAPSFPALTGRVVDQANILSPEVEASLDGKLQSLETSTKRQLVVVTLASLQGYEIEEYGYQLGRAWKIGRASENDGTLLIVAPNERSVRIEVGYGLEGVLTDALSSVILNTQVLPLFRDGKMEEGVVAGADALIEQLRLPAFEAAQRVETAKAAAREQPTEFPSLFMILLVLWILFLILRGPRRRRGVMPWVLPPVIISSGRRGGGWGGGGGFSGGGGGGFSGGGGSFGGGGASGKW